MMERSKVRKVGFEVVNRPKQVFMSPLEIPVPKVANASMDETVAFIRTMQVGNNNAASTNKRFYNNVRHSVKFASQDLVEDQIKESLMEFYPEEIVKASETTVESMSLNQGFTVNGKGKNPYTGFIIKSIHIDKEENKRTQLGAFYLISGYSADSYEEALNNIISHEETTKYVVFNNQLRIR